MLARPRDRGGRGCGRVPRHRRADPGQARPGPDSELKWQRVTACVLSTSWPGLSRPSTSLTRTQEKKDVDARDKRGHDAEKAGGTHSAHHRRLHAFLSETLF